MNSINLAHPHSSSIMFVMTILRHSLLSYYQMIAHVLPKSSPLPQHIALRPTPLDKRAQMCCQKRAKKIISKIHSHSFGWLCTALKMASKCTPFFDTPTITHRYPSTLAHVDSTISNENILHHEQHNEGCIKFPHADHEISSIHFDEMVSTFKL
jgi:hypothetical protein